MSNLISKMLQIKDINFVFLKDRDEEDKQESKSLKTNSYQLFK
ncbi:hypothetical protein STAR110904_09765 [Staphylococcus argensis]